MEPIPQTEIARKNCVTESIVQSVLKTINFGLPAHLPETINIDEFKGNSGIWNQNRHKWYLNKYHCNISDGDSHAVIDILDQISGTYLHKYFQQFPNAKICIDPFHVVNRLNDMVDAVRRRYQHQFQKNV